MVDVAMVIVCIAPCTWHMHIGVDHHFWPMANALRKIKRKTFFLKKMET
jgi:hypothetical protein